MFQVFPPSLVFINIVYDHLPGIRSSLDVNQGYFWFVGRRLDWECCLQPSVFKDFFFLPLLICVCHVSRTGYNRLLKPQTYALHLLIAYSSQNTCKHLLHSILFYKDFGTRYQGKGDVGMFTTLHEYADEFKERQAFLLFSFLLHNTVPFLCLFRSAGFQGVL